MFVGRNAVMSRPVSFGHVKVGIGPGVDPGMVDPETPMQVLLLGDWANRAARGVPPAGRLADRKVMPIDRDNFEEVLTRLGVEVGVPLAGAASPPVTIRIGELDDFHPDRLFERLEVFQALRKLRGRLLDSATFSAAAAEMRGWAGADTPAEAPTPTPASAPAPPIQPSNLLEQMLSQTQARPRPGGGMDWQAVIKQIVEPYLLPRTDYSRQAQLVTLVDAALAGQMRQVLHQREFQAAETAWRALFFLCRRLDTDATLKLYLLDVTRDELAADLRSSDDLRSTGIYRLLVERTLGTPGGQPWGILVGHYTFGDDVEEVELLGRMAQVAAGAGAPFLAGASPRIVGCTSLGQTPDPDDWKPAADSERAQAWEALRQLPQACYIGLALPRFLLRVPYGKKTNPVERFALEEMPDGPEHDNYLWGNPAIAVAYLLAGAFSRYGWDFRPGVLNHIDNLPAHLYSADGETQLQPCAEAWLTDRAAEAILDRGLMPLQSVQGRDEVHLPSFLSVARPQKLLAGRWTT
jgi:type VI secretion system protein ImpC